MLGPQQERFVHLTVNSSQNQNVNTLNQRETMSSTKPNYAEHRAQDQNGQYRAISKFNFFELPFATVDKLSAKLRECQIEVGQLKKEKC